MAKLDEQLASVLSTLEACRAVLVDSEPQTASLLSVVILELQTKLNQISEIELKALCDAMLPEPSAIQAAEKMQHRHRGLPVLKVVK